MLHVLSLIFFLRVSIINCAVPGSYIRHEIDDLESAPVLVDFDRLDPRNQAISSSYSIVETRGFRQPGPITYTRSEYEPDGETSQHRRFIKEGQREENPRFYNSFNNDDDESPLSKEFIYNDADNFFPSQKLKKEPTKRLKENRSRRPKPSKTHPKSINEIVEKSHSSPLIEGSSSGVKKSKVKNDDRSGSYVRDKIGDESYEEGHEEEKHYDKEDGKKFIEAHKAEAGEKADEGYKKEEGYDKAEKEKHDKEKKKAVIAEKEGAKKGHHDEEKHFGEEYKGQSGEKGLSVTKKGGHKKGHKKNGFHKVYNKEEFKKDEVFYDEGHDGDDHEEHAHEHEKHHKEKGGAAKKQHLDSAYREGHGEKKGVQDKGHHFEEASGHKKEAGEQQHHDEHSKYGKEAGVTEGAKFGHSEGGAKEGGYVDDGY